MGSCAYGQAQGLGVKFDPSDTAAYRAVGLIGRQFALIKGFYLGRQQCTRILPNSAQIDFPWGEPPPPLLTYVTLV